MVVALEIAIIQSSLLGVKLITLDKKKYLLQTANHITLTST